MGDSNRTGRTLVPGAVISGDTLTPGQTAPGQQGAGLDQMLEVVADGPNPGAPQSFLLVISGSDPGRLLVLDRPEMVIGRSKYADVKVSERAMSQQHAKLVRVGDHHRLYDLGSTNGTFVNDQRVEQADLKVGDVIRTGETVFTYMSSAGGDQNDKTLALPSARSSPPATRAPAMATGVPATRARNVPAVRTGAMPQVLEAPNYAADEGDAITLILRLLRFFRRYWLSFVILTLIGATAGVASYRFRRPPALAAFEIDLVPKPSDNPVERQRRMTLEFFRSATQTFVRPQLIADTLAELGETDLTPQRIRSIQRRLLLKRSRGSQTMYTGSYEAPTADESMDFLRVHLKLFLEQEVEKALQVLIVEVQTLEKNLAQAEEELNATEQSILAFKEEHSEGLPDQAQQFYQELFELDARSAAIASDVARAAAEVDLSKRRLKSESPLIESRIQMARPYEDAIAEVKRDLAAAKAAGKGNQHPDVIELKQQLKRLEDLRDDVIARGSSSNVIKNKNPVYEGARRSLQDANAAHKIARSELGRLGADKKRIEKIVAELPRLQQEYAELTRNYDSTKVVHNNLYEKLNSSKIQLDMERAAASTRFNVITPPNVEKVSAVRTMIKRGFVAGVLGFMFAAALGLLRDLRRLLAARARLEAQRG